jgi:hypothetical protein
MVFSQDGVTCPVCGSAARLTRKWVLNKYSKRYDYFVYHHKGYVHYANQNTQSSKGFRKGQLEKILIETINSQAFKLGSFRISDLKKLLVGSYPNIGFGSLKVSLNRLAEVGIVERQKIGMRLFYINTVSKERLSFIIDSVSFSLEDIGNDSMLTKHTTFYKIKNDHTWPLYFIPYRVVGDSDIDFKEMKLSGFDHTNSKFATVILIEEAPKDKRFLLKLPTPLFPGEFREIIIEYYWPEPKQTYVFSAATKVTSFEFSISGNNLGRLTVSLTSVSNNETIDLSKEVKETSTSKWESVRRIKLTEVEPFSVLQLKWR